MSKAAIGVGAGNLDLIEILRRGPEAWNQWREENPDAQIDLSAANLHGADLHGADLSAANLHGADLHGADLSAANLHGADLHGADLSAANLSNANLSGANLASTDLTDSQLYDTNLSGANLSDADLNRANLSNAILSRANLSRANLSRANLSRANLNGADLSSALLIDTDLNGADLNGADLNGANLNGADLRSANLTSVIITWETKIDAKWRPSSSQLITPSEKTHENFKIRIFDSDIDSNDLAQLQSALDIFAQASGYEEVTVTREEFGSFFKDIRYKIARWISDDVQREAIETGQELYRTGKANVLNRLEKPGVESSKQIAEATAALLKASENFDNVVLQAGKIIVIKITDENGKSRGCSRTVSSEIQILLERSPQLIDNPQALYDVLTKSQEKLPPAIEDQKALPVPPEVLK